MNKQEILNSVRDAVTASGKGFAEINKESFFKFFERGEVPKSLWESLYKELEKTYKPKKETTKVKSGSVSMDDTMEKIMDSTPDYYSTTQNDVKKRTPRKSIFGDISKVG